MKLRSQLILVSLLTLSLPWAGCQYIREMESTLREGQGQVLVARAQAMAALLSNIAEIVALQSPTTSNNSAATGGAVYAHTLKTPPTVDGYGDDWRNLGFRPQVYPSALTQSPTPAEPLNKPFSMSLRAATSPNPEGLGTVYLFVEVNDKQLNYHRPSAKTMASGDHLVVRGLAQGSQTSYIITTSAPGPIQCNFLNKSGQVKPEFGIKGLWRERTGGYQVELRIDPKLVSHGFSLEVVDQQEGSVHRISTSHNNTNSTRTAVTERAEAELGKLVSINHKLNASLEKFTQPGITLRVVDKQSWLRASVTGTQQENTHPKPQGNPWWLAWAYRKALHKALQGQYLPSRGEPQNSGRWDFPEVASALNKQEASRWYQSARDRLGSAAVPIIQDDIILGAVVVEQSSRQLLSLTSTAFNTLFLYSFGVSILVALGFIAYASWLSWRIRRLSSAANIQTQGATTQNPLNPITKIPQQKAGDELGELSRNFHGLMTQLHEYTDYLKTLANKLSHELRTPLAVIRSSLDNLALEPLSDQGKTFAERASEGTARLSRILTAMSEASRVEASINQAELETLKLEHLLQELVAAYKDTYTTHSIELEVQAQSFPIMGSPDLLVQMLDKLVDNATDFCPLGGLIKIKLSNYQQSGEADMACLQVINEGPLLPEKMRAQLFDSMVSVRKKNSDKTNLGLGLHIVRLITVFHQGQVQASNLRDSSGVVFSVLIPLEFG